VRAFLASSRRRHFFCFFLGQLNKQTNKQTHSPRQRRLLLLNARTRLPDTSSPLRRSSPRQTSRSATRRWRLPTRCSSSTKAHTTFTTLPHAWLRPSRGRRATCSACGASARRRFASGRLCRCTFTARVL
jgi:hypothetical protein